MLKNKPEIRFTEFKNDWVHQSLNKVVERVIRKNKNNESKVPLTISAQYGLVDQVTYFNKQIASTDLSNYFLLQKGDFAYNKSYSKDYPWGAIKRLDKYEEGVLSSLYIVFKPTRVHSDFLVPYYETSRWYKEVSMRATEGARNHGLLNISAVDFLETELSIPVDFEEQMKIGSFFKNLDETIALHQQELEALKQTKQGFLQKMFPQEGELVPKIRFSEYKSEWKSIKLSDLTTFFTDGDWIESKDQSEEGIRLIQTGNIGISKFLNKPGKEKWITEETFKKLKCHEIYAGDILISRLPEPAGRACILPNLETRMITAVDCTIIRVDDNNSSEFLLQYLSTNQYFNMVKSYLGGGTRQRISRSVLGDLIIRVPKELTEQVKIGEFFRQLDEVIELKEKELEALKETKKGFLQKMFV